jgi:dienelactone hydrolase
MEVARGLDAREDAVHRVFSPVVRDVAEAAVMPTHGAAVNRGAARAGEDAMRGTMAALASLAIALVAPAASAQPYDGPPSAWTAYWDVPAFSDHPYKGAAAAKGVVFWSHGVSGKLAQYDSPPPAIMRDFARAGWDVVKVQRNNLHENGWSVSGGRHVADLVERIEKAHAQGYRRIVAAGQSYGGAISIEASARTDRLFGVLATGPGHGSDTCGGSATGARGGARLADTVQRQLADAISRMKAPRAIVVMAAKDECQGFNDPGPSIRAALAAAPGKFLFLDEAMPLAGHSAAFLAQFRTWYGECIQRFLDPDLEPAGKETTCPHPAGDARFLFPANFRMPAQGAVGRLSGPWSGVLEVEGAPRREGQEVCVAVETESTARGELVATIAFGAGTERKLSMSSSRRLLRRDGEGYTYAASASAYRLSLSPAGSAELAIAIVSSDGKVRYAARLRRGC